MSRLLRRFRGKFCTLYREEGDGTSYGWTGTVLGYDRVYIKVKGPDGRVRLINQSSLDVIIEGNWAAELEVRVNSNSKKEKED